jgi:hypothetical protein
VACGDLQAYGSWRPVSQGRVRPDAVVVVTPRPDYNLSLPEPVESYGGFSDFSWPGAHEDDAEGAAHASLTVAQVRDGEGQVVVLSGEPRMGKSRPGLPLPAIIRAHPLPLLLLRSPNRTICEAPTAFRGSFTSTPSEHDAGCFQVSCAFQCSRRNLLMSEKSGRMAE